MWVGLSGDVSIFLRNFTMKLSTVRFVGPASSPQNLLKDLVARHRLPDPLVQEPQELHFVERELLGRTAHRHHVRREVHLCSANRDGVGDGTDARGSPEIARRRAMSSFTLNGLVM